MIIALIGHSSSGKSTVESRLSEMGFERIISYTTRPIREGEKDGVAYHFIVHSTFCEMKKQGRFQETAKYRDWHYGLSLDGVDYKSKDYIVVVTKHGYDELLKAVGEEYIKSIFIKVDERKRLIRQLHRGDEVDEVIRRVYADREDFSEVEQLCDFTVENENLEDTINAVLNIIGSVKNER